MPEVALEKNGVVMTDEQLVKANEKLLGDISELKNKLAAAENKRL